MTKPILCAADGRIGRVTLNRPEVLNAIDDRLPQALADAIRQAISGPEVHVIVLSANEEVGWRLAVREREEGTYDWTLYRPISPRA